MAVFCFSATIWSPAVAHAQCEPIGWKAFGSGVAGGDSDFYPSVQGIATFDDGTGVAVYVTGNFTSIDGVPANYVARWDGREWSALGAGLDERGLCLQVYDDGNGPALYVGGEFLNAGGQSAKHIAKWNGKTWSPLGTGIVGSNPTRVNCLTVFDSYLYVGGQFTSAGGVSSTANVAKWDGQAWFAGPASVATNDFAIMDLGSGPALYAATSLGVRKLVNNSWTVIGATSTGHPVNAIEPYTPLGGTLGLYAGGQFMTIGGATAKNLAVWNGTSWAQVGFGTQGIVEVLHAADGAGGPLLYVGGNIFHSASSTTGAYIQGVGAWNGTTTLPLGVGIGPGETGIGGGGIPAEPVTALLRCNDGHGEALWAGGSFALAGGNLVNGLAKWSPIIDQPNLNHNQWQDACEIEAGFSLDCDKDGVPDDCQGGAEYRLDYGTSSGAWGLSGDLVWLNQFTVLSGAEVITCVKLPWSYLTHEGAPITVMLYSDPDQDGDPADAALLASAGAVNLCQSGLPMEFGYVPITPTLIGPAGTSFFVGAKAELGGDFYPDYMASADTSEPILHRSWHIYGATGTIDIHDLSSGSVPLTPDDFNWVLRALSQDCNGNLTLDSCDIASGFSTDVNGDGRPDECVHVPCMSDIAPVVRDGSVDVDDLFTVINAWGACKRCSADIDSSGQVDIDDLFAVINAWGPCP